MSTAEEILKRLHDNLQRETLSTDEQESLLSQLKVFSRQPNIVRELFTSNAVVTLSTYGLTRLHSAEALRSLANALFLVEPHRQTFVDKGFAIDAAKLLQTCDYDHEFLLCRILFLLTYKTNLNFDQLDSQTALCKSITRLCQRHANVFASRTAKTTSQQTQALDETLKFLFNSTHFFPSLSKRLEPAIKPMIILLLRCPLQKPPLQPPIASLINALLNVDISATAEALEGNRDSQGGNKAAAKALEDNGNSRGNNKAATTTLEDKGLSQSDVNAAAKEEDDHNNAAREDAETADGIESELEKNDMETEGINIRSVVDRLIEIFDHAVREHPIEELDSIATPLCTLLRRVCEVGGDHLRKQMSVKLLPQDDERGKPLGEGDTLAAHLLRLSVSAELPNLGKYISSLLFELSNKDPEQFVHNVGYGYASGHLLNSGMTAPIPTSSSQSSRRFNPVTGQNIDQEDSSKIDPSEMTDEEKEREAERLFVLFERLKATGVVDVKNPIERLHRDAD